MNRIRIFPYTILLSIFIGNLFGLSSDFLYNNKKLNEAKAQTYYDLANQPDKVFSYDDNIQLGKCNYYLRSFNQANNFFFRALKCAQDSFDIAVVYYWLGRNALIKNDAEKATQYFNRTFQYNKNIEPDFLFFYGMALYTIGRFDDALNVFLNFENQSKNASQFDEQNLFFGASALGKGDYNLAEQYLIKAISQNDQKFSPIPEYLLGLTYYLENEPDMSLDQFVKVKSDTVLSLKERAHLVSGTIYINEGDISSAITEFEAVINDTQQIRPQLALSEINKEEAYLRSGIAHYKSKKTKTALARFDSLRQRYPNSHLNEWAIYYTAEIHQKNSKLLKAKSGYKQLIATYPHSSLSENSRYNLGLILYQEQNYIEAITVLDDFLNEFPKSPFRKDALFTIIQSYNKTGENSKLKTAGEKFLNEFPSSTEVTDVHYKLGVIGVEKKDYAYARRYFNYIRRGTFYPYALKGLGDVFLALDSLSLALQFYNSAEKICSDSLIDEVRYNREIVYQKQRLYETDFDRLKGYLEKYPESRKAGMVQYKIGQYFFQQGNISQAIAEFDKVRQFNSSSEYIEKAEMNKAQIYKTLGETHQAIESYRIVINEIKTVYFRTEAMKSLADLYFLVQDYDSAMVLYNQLISEFPKRPESESAMIKLAEIYKILGKLVDATKLLEQFLIRYPRSINLNFVYLNIADSYKEMGKYDQSEKVLKESFNKAGKFGDLYFKLAEVNLLQNKPISAKVNFSEAYSLYQKENKSDLAALSLFEAGKCAVNLKLFDQAKELFQHCINETQDERLRIQCEEWLKQIPSAEK